MMTQPISNLLVCGWDPWALDLRILIFVHFGEDVAELIHVLEWKELEQQAAKELVTHKISTRGEALWEMCTRNITVALPCKLQANCRTEIVIFLHRNGSCLSNLIRGSLAWGSTWTSRGIWDVVSHQDMCCRISPSWCGIQTKYRQSHYSNNLATSTAIAWAGHNWQVNWLIDCRCIQWGCMPGNILSC